MHLRCWSILKQGDHARARKLINLREVKSSFLMRLNSVFVGCLLIVVPYLIITSRFSCCQVLGGELAITQDQSLFTMLCDFSGLSDDFITASFKLKYYKKKNVVNCCYFIQKFTGDYGGIKSRKWSFWIFFVGNANEYDQCPIPPMRRACRGSW